MGKGSGKMPSAPDPYQTAQAQANVNKQAAYDSAAMNQIGQQTPWGTVSYTGAIGSPDRKQITSLSPEQQKQFDLQNSNSSSMLGLANNRLGNFESSLPSLSNNYSADADKVSQATYDRGMNLLNPQFQQQSRQLDTSLANKGIPIGSEAYNRSMDQQSTARNNALNDLSLQSVGAGRQEQSRLQNQALQQRGQMFNELGQLTGAGNVQAPQAYQPAQQQMAAPDLMGQINQNYQNQMAQYNAKKQNSPLNGLFGLAGTLGSMFM